MADRNTRGITLSPDDEPEKPASSGPSGTSAGKTSQLQVRTMTLVAFVRLYKLKFNFADLESTGAAVVDLCRSKGVVPREIKDDRFGLIRLYPEWLLKEFFKIRS